MVFFFFVVISCLKKFKLSLRNRSITSAEILSNLQGAKTLVSRFVERCLMFYFQAFQFPHKENLFPTAIFLLLHISFKKQLLQFPSRYPKRHKCKYEAKVYCWTPNPWIDKLPTQCLLWQPQHLTYILKVHWPVLLEYQY